MDFLENPVEHDQKYDFHENCDSWIWPGNHRSGHESVGIFVDFLRCRAMFHYHMTRRAVSLKSNTVPRIKLATNDAAEFTWLGPRRMDFSHRIGWVQQLYLIFARAHMHKDCFSEAMSF